MQHTPYFTSIPVHSIDPADRTYCFSPLPEEGPDDDLVESIGRYGILHPPIIGEKKSRHIIIAGRKRIAAARRLSVESVFCLLVPAGMPHQDVLRLLVEESLYGRGLSLVEQARLMDSFLPGMPVDAALPLLQAFGHRPQRHMLEELLSLLSLDPAAVAAIHRGQISFPAAMKIRRLPKNDQETAAGLITALRFGSSKQNKFLAYCTELVMRTGLPLRDLLASFTAEGADGDSENIPQRAGALLRELHRTCHPRITEAEAAFRKAAAALKLPDNARLEHAPSFEEDRVTLSLQLHDMEEVRRLLPAILKLTGEKEGR